MWQTFRTYTAVLTTDYIGEKHEYGEGQSPKRYQNVFWLEWIETLQIGRMW